MSSRLRVLAVLVVVLGGCSEESKVGVDTVFFNGAVYTVDASQEWAEAVAVDGDKIVYVGDSNAALALAADNTERIDLNGKLMLPGFIDSHFHPLNGGAYVNALSLNTYGTPDEWIAAIAEYAEQRPDQEVLFGYGFLATTFGPVGPTRQQIDAVVPDRPVLIVDEGFHGGWANSAALSALNITQDTPDPEPGYSYYKRDANGDATGYLLEGTANMAMDAFDVKGDDVVVTGTGDVIEIMNAYGITAGFDAGGKLPAARTKILLDRVAAAGELTLRLKGSVRARKEDLAETTIARALRRKNTVEGDNYHYDTLKIPNDGTVESRTAAMFEDYQGEPGNSGETVFTAAEMAAMVTGAARENIDVHIHALGERAINEALNAIEAAREAAPDSSTRYAICHIQVITDQDLPRFAELDVIAQSTPLWASYDTYGEQFVSEDQFSRYWRFNSLKDLGVRLSFGSDFPASGAGTLGLSPIVQIEIGHTRQDPGDPESLVQPRETERLDVEALVRGFTIDAAYQMHMENEIGSIEVGKKADLVILNQNIFEVDAYDIHKTEVVLTMMDGDIVYEMATE